MSNKEKNKKQEPKREMVKPEREPEIAPVMMKPEREPRREPEKPPMTIEETQIEQAFNNVLEAETLDAQVLAKKQLLITINQGITKDPKVFGIFFNAVQESDSPLFGVRHGAIDELNYGADATVKAWNAMIVIVNLLLDGGKLPFKSHGVQSQFIGNYEHLGKLLSKAIA